MPKCLRARIGWFGVRGIGSLCQLMFALEHALPESTALERLHITLIVITLAIALHGVSVKPRADPAAQRGRLARIMRAGRRVPTPRIPPGGQRPRPRAAPAAG